MTRLSDWLIGILSALGLLVLLGWRSERDRRIEAESEARQIDRALRTPCPPVDGQRVVASVGYDGAEFARWCGYYRTVIETVRISWERQ